MIQGHSDCLIAHPHSVNCLITRGPSESYIRQGFSMLFFRLLVVPDYIGYSELVSCEDIKKV
jgi:hypothetical protein